MMIDVKLTSDARPSMSWVQVATYALFEAVDRGVCRERLGIFDARRGAPPVMSKLASVQEAWLALGSFWQQTRDYLGRTG